MLRTLCHAILLNVDRSLRTFCHVILFDVDCMLRTCALPLRHSVQRRLNVANTSCPGRVILSKLHSVFVFPVSDYTSAVACTCHNRCHLRDCQSSSLLCVARARLGVFVGNEAYAFESTLTKLREMAPGFPAPCGRKEALLNSSLDSLSYFMFCIYWDVGRKWSD